MLKHVLQKLWARLLNAWFTITTFQMKSDMGIPKLTSHLHPHCVSHYTWSHDKTELKFWGQFTSQQEQIPFGAVHTGPSFPRAFFQHLTHEHREGGTHNVQITWILNISSSGYENLFLQVGYFLLLHHISRSAPHFFFFFTAFLSAASRIFRRQDSFCVNGPLKG